jgi:RimJ/RimL family protein N-acetyltransferase
MIRYDTIQEVTELLEICISDPLSFRSTVSVLAASSIDSKDSRIIGLIGISSRLLVSYEFHPSFWGNGFATEALHHFVERYFVLFPNSPVVYALVDSNNLASARVLEKCGFGKNEEEVNLVADGELGAERKAKNWMQYTCERSRAEYVFSANGV